MMYFSRPYHNRLHRPLISAGFAFLVAATAIYASQPAQAQTAGLAELLGEPNPLLHSSSQGYLGVLVGDVDSDSAAKLKLKEVRGAVVTLIDHDAPGAQAGIHVNDVVVQLNGQAVESAEAFSRMLREIPAGRTVSIVISRDGALQTISVELADHKKMEHDVWNRLDNGGDATSTAPGMGILEGGSGDVPSSGFHMPFFGSTLNVGAMVEPLTSQMADYLGIQGGLMVKQVARKSEAEAAGIKAFDVILKVGTDNISTTADWDRSLRSNQNKPVQVTILRDRKQQTVTLQVDSKHHRSELEFENLFNDGNCPIMAAFDSDAADALAEELAGNDSAIQSMRNQAEALHDQLGDLQFSISPEQLEEFRKQAEETARQFSEQMKSGQFAIDQRQLDEWKKQADALQKSFNADQFKLNQQQKDELKKQMEEFRQQFKQEDFKFEKKQLDEFKRQAEKFQTPEFQKQLREQLRKQMEQMKHQLEDMQDHGIPHFV